jgi:hypothetical protein
MLKATISVMGFLALGCAGGSQLGPVKLASPRFEFTNLKADDSCTEPYWKVEDLQLDSSCGGLFDYCVRARATVKSLADVAQHAEVFAVYTTPEGKEVKKKQDVSLDPREILPLTFTFDEASMGDDKPKVRVSVDSKACARVSCDVSNTGDAAGTAQVEGLFGGQTRAQSVNLAPAQTRTVTFDFAGMEAKGAGSCRMAPS